MDIWKNTDGRLFLLGGDGPKRLTLGVARLEYWPESKAGSHLGYECDVVLTGLLPEDKATLTSLVGRELALCFAPCGDPNWYIEEDVAYRLAVRQWLHTEVQRPVARFASEANYVGCAVTYRCALCLGPALPLNNHA